MIFFWLACWMDDSTYLEERERFFDRDGDGFTPNDGDCDDANPMLHPDADEVCDDLDNNCDGLLDIDPITGSIWYTANANGCFDQRVIACFPPDEPYQVTAEDCP